MTGKLEFASPAWLEALLALRRKTAAKDPAARGVTCEVYLNAPPHLANDPRGRIVWTITVADGTASLSTSEVADDEADTKIEGDYAFVQDLARLVINDDNLDAVGVMMRDAFRAGRFRTIRQARRGPYDPTIHNRMAEITA